MKHPQPSPLAGRLPLWRGWLATTAIAAIAGCGAAGLVLKQPIAEKCSGAGLQRCDELVDAALLYIDGDKARAEPKLRSVAQANSPEKIQAFTTAVKTVLGVLGEEQRASFDGVLSLLEGEPPGPNAKGSAAASSPAPVALRQVDVVRTGMLRPGTDTKAVACDSPLASDQARCRKVRATMGPFTVTNLFAAGGCPDELFVYAGAWDAPHWLLSTPPNAPLNVSGRFAVDDGESIFVGARATQGVPQPDSRCAIVWSGFSVGSE